MRLPLHVVRFPDAPNQPHVHVVFASTAAAIKRGLANEQSLPPNAGMLFLFDSRSLRSFWMRDVRFPLDMIFIDGHRIVSIAENATPLSDKLHYVNSPVTAVLEVNARWARQHGVRAGQHVELPS